MLLLFVIGLVENPTATEEEKNFLVTPSRHRHCSLLSLFVASSFVVRHLLSDKPPFLFNWSFIHLKPGYSTTPSRSNKQEPREVSS